MKFVNKQGKLALPAFLLSGLLLTPLLAQAASVTVNLGQTNENFTMAGTGADGAGLGHYVVTLGACSPNGGSTTCTLTGSFTGTTPGFTAGTYTLTTTYQGTGTSPFLGIEQGIGSIYFSFDSIPSTATVTLTLHTASGDFIAPMVANSNFASGANFAFYYGANATCVGVSAANCNVAQVGVTSGSSITGPVTGQAVFIGSLSYYFSDLAISGGYQTTLTYVNYSPQAVTCTTKFYLDNGSPWQIPFASGTFSTRTDTMQPGQSVHDQTIATLTPPYIQGWAIGSCSGPVQASLLYRYYVNGVAAAEAGVNAETNPTTKFATFAQTATGVAYANPSPTNSATITMIAFSTTGAPLGSKVFTLGPLQHGSANVGPLLGLGSFSGFIELISTSPIISLSLNAEAFPVISSLPAGDLPDNTTLFGN